MLRPTLLAAAFALVTFATARADVTTVRVAEGLDRPVFATSAPGDPNRLFIVEQHSGEIKILDLTTWEINPQEFLDVGNLSTGDEQGLLGLAFHPDYQNNGQFFINKTDAGGTTRIERYQVSANPDVALTTATSVLSIAQPQGNHNGGWIGFGPNDGYLYISSGDGGGGDDNDTGHTNGIGNGQDNTNLLGAMLRIDVDSTAQGNYGNPGTNPFVGVAGADEIWAYGLRNPWRASFDRDTGDLYIGDVGQNAREEIDVQPAASVGGENYGWRLREGTIPTPTGGVGGAKPAGAIDPIYDYEHGGGANEGFSVTGGYVYRGPIDEIQGDYFFADFATERIWSLEFDGSDPNTHDGTNFTNFVDRTSQLAPVSGAISQISSFGEDHAGNLYLTELSRFVPNAGELFRVYLVGDANGDAVVNGLDANIISLHWLLDPAEYHEGDLNGDGVVNGLDANILSLHWLDGNSAAAIPEPSAAVLALVAVLATTAARRRRRPRS